MKANQKNDIFESDDEEEEEEEPEEEQNENDLEDDDEEEKEEKDDNENKKTKPKSITKNKKIIDIDEELEEEKDKPKKSNNILYGILIVGLPFETTETELKNIFSKYGEIVRVYLPKYKNTQKNIGHCYIYFSNEESAQKSLELNNHRIRNRYMEISLSNIRNNNFKDTNEKIDPDDVPLDCTTAFVKNLAYHVTEKEVEEKFKTCGDINQIRFVYEPQTNKFKGFCYIDFKEHKGLLKALRLNGSFFGNRKLYVDYEQGKPKKEYKSHEDQKEVSLLNRKRY
jgi:RNA recognition motif-containing protein